MVGYLGTEKPKNWPAERDPKPASTVRNQTNPQARGYNPEPNQQYHPPNR